MKKTFTLLAATLCLAGMQAAVVTVAPAGDKCDVTVDALTITDVPVTTVGDIHLLAINRDGVSLLVRYTDATTLVADGTVNGETVHYATEAAETYAKTFQIPNSDFETWGTNKTEPRYWHGFKSATGSLASMAKGTLGSSDNTRPGTTGSKSAVVTSGSIFGIINNGTMTNGRLKAASTTAASTDNHSEMDQGSTATDNYGDPFFTALHAAPDAIKTWIKFSQGTANSSYPYATLSAIAFDGSYYQDPEDKTYNNVAAKAQNKTITVCGWTELTVPFTYTDASKAKAILVTVSTNATPGKGSSGDKVWVDDMELVYNAAISGIALDGVTVEGFTFDAATTDYTLYYSGAAQTITADNFVVTAAGQSAIVVKNVEDLGCGNYRVAIGVTGPDFKNQALYTITINKRPVYILGEVNGKTWAANDGVPMDTEDGTTYTATVTTEKEDGNYFSFTSELAIYNDEGSWSYIAPYRFGAELGGEGDFWITDALLDTPLNLGKDGTDRAYRLEKGEWDMTLDMSARTLTVTKVQKAITGDVDGNGTVDVSDINTLVNIVLGKESKDNYPMADLDGDGAADVSDINALVNIILGR